MISVSVYDEGAVLVGGAPPAAVVTSVPASIDVETVRRTVVDQIKSDPGFAELVAEQLRGEKAYFAVPSKDLIAADESYEVEFKATARWNLREQCKDSRMEDAVVKAIAGFLNADGGTLFIGVGDDRRPVGLSADLSLVRPPSVDGLVNWLTTHLINALKHAAVMRTRTRIDDVDGFTVCRIDVARSSAPVTARMSDRAERFWVG